VGAVVVVFEVGVVERAVIELQLILLLLPHRMQSPWVEVVLILHGQAVMETLPIMAIMVTIQFFILSLQQGVEVVVLIKVLLELPERMVDRAVVVEQVKILNLLVARVVVLLLRGKDRTVVEDTEKKAVAVVVQELLAERETVVRHGSVAPEVMGYPHQLQDRL
jgi:hypothetical protein